LVSGERINAFHAGRPRALCRGRGSPVTVPWSAHATLRRGIAKVDGLVITGQLEITDPTDWLAGRLARVVDGSFPIVRARSSSAYDFLIAKPSCANEIDAERRHGDAPPKGVPGAGVRTRPNVSLWLHHNIRRGKMT
jgi:hypothetical protein